MITDDQHLWSLMSDVVTDGNKVGWSGNVGRGSNTAATPCP